jgi:hypothetical protein
MSGNPGQEPNTKEHRDSNMNDLEKRDFTTMQSSIAVILERTKVIPDMDKKLNEIDKKQTMLCERVENNRADIGDLKKKSDTWNIMNSIGAFLAMIVGSIYGTK